MATNIHFPSDNSLLLDGVKVISRLLSQAKKILLPDSKNINLSIFRNRHRTARRISRQIDSLSKTRNQSDRQKREKAYSKLIDIAKASWKQAEKVKLILGNSNLLESRQLIQKFEIFIPRVQQVIEQTQRRILNERESTFC